MKQRFNYSVLALALLMNSFTISVAEESFKATCPVMTQELEHECCDLQDLQLLAEQQVREIECILSELKKLLEQAPTNNHKLIAQAINFLHESMRNITADKVKNFKENELKSLLDLNEALINHLVTHIDGNLSELCDIGQAFKAYEFTQHREFISTQELYERYNQLQGKIHFVLNGVENFDFSARADEAIDVIADAADNVIDTLTFAAEENPSLALISAQLAAFASICYFGGFKRAVAYTTLPLYWLRAMPNKEVAQQFPSLLWLKKLVGTSELAYSVALNCGDDLADLLAWKKEQEAKHNIKIKIAKDSQSDWNMLKNFGIKITDGTIFHYSLQALFLDQLRKDLTWLGDQLDGLCCCQS